MGYRGDGTPIQGHGFFFAQSYTLWPLKCDWQPPSIQWRYSYVVLSFSNPGVVAWARPDSIHTNQSTFRTFTWSRRANNLPIPHLLGTLMDGPDSFGSCLGYCLEHTGHAITTLAKLLYFKGNVAFLAICHRPMCHGRCSFYAPSLL